MTARPVPASVADGDPEAIIAVAGPVLRTRMARAETRLAEVVGTDTGPLSEHASATIAAGGKRLRPLLVFLAAGGEGQGDEGDEPLVRAGVAVELVHSATLVHDDILDAAALRRGRPTIVAAAGRDIAIATGDLLFSRAFAELARNGSVAQLRALSSASSALAEGELLQRSDAFDVEVPLERYLHRCELKTARLFEAACRLGALASPGIRDDGDGRAPSRSSEAAALGDFARRIGLAFQLLDDVLDVSGPPSRTGKRRGTDLLDGTVTLPLILARERDTGLARVDLRAIGGPAEAEALCERIEATGALSEARRRALSLVAEAKAELSAGLPPMQRRLFELVADGVVERYR